MSYVIRKNISRCQEVVARDKQVIAACQHLSYYPFVVASGKNAVLKDIDGNEYIDFLASASSLNLGSSHPAVTEAIRKQLDNCTQYAMAYTYNDPAVTYAEKLVSVYPGGVKAKVCYGNCGSDANDAAIKFARAYTGRSKIITFINAYHGNTYGSCSLTAVTTRMRSKVGPFLPEVYHFPFYGTDVSDEVCEAECIKDMESAFERWLPPEEVAAVIIEPVQGDAGILPAHPIFMKKLYELCRRHGVLFFAEEVQQAFFRSGHWFSIENYPDIIPDGIIMGKSIGGGLTLGAFMAREDIIDSLPAPAHLFTLSGNAIACTAGSAAFDVYQSKEFQTHLKTVSAKMKERLDQLQARYPKTIGAYRGYTMSYGIPIITTAASGETASDADGAFKIVFRAYEKGLIVITLNGNILRIQPPLTIEPETLDKAFDILEEAVQEYQEGQIPDDVFQYRQGW